MIPSYVQSVPVAMGVIAFIEDKDVIKKILEHLDLWDVKR